MYCLAVGNGGWGLRTLQNYTGPKLDLGNHPDSETLRYKRSGKKKAEQKKMHSCLVKRMLCNIKLQIAYERFPCM